MTNKILDGKVLAENDNFKKLIRYTNIFTLLCIFLYSKIICSEMHNL